MRAKPKVATTQPASGIRSSIDIMRSSISFEPDVTKSTEKIPQGAQDPHDQLRATAAATVQKAYREKKNTKSAKQNPNWAGLRQSSSIHTYKEVAVGLLRR